MVDGPRRWTYKPVKILSIVLPIVGRFSGGYSIQGVPQRREGGSSVWVNVSVAGPELGRFGGRPIGQALTAQFHRQAPPRNFLVSSGTGGIICPFFLGFLSSGHFSRGKKVYNGRRKKSSVSYSSSTESILNFLSVSIKEGKKFLWSKWFVDSSPFSDNFRNNSNEKEKDDWKNFSSINHIVKTTREKL